MASTPGNSIPLPFPSCILAIGAFAFINSKIQNITVIIFFLLV